MKAKSIDNNSDLSDLKKDLLVAQEINFAKVLAGNDKKLRDRAVKKLKKWLAIRSKGKCVFTEDDFQRIWSGLFYCMWMSDKFLVQEELAESISNLIHCFHNNVEAALLFMKCFYKTMAMEWSGLDQHRLDKFSMLTRRFLRQSFEFCKRKEWDESISKQFIKLLEDTVLNVDAPLGLVLHVIDIYPEEVAKVSKGTLAKEIILILFESFIKLLADSPDTRYHNAVINLFDHLIRQTDIGIEYEEKLAAWKRLRFPSRTPEDLELCLEGDDDVDPEVLEEEEMLRDEPLDPRAGRVDVVLPQLSVDFGDLLSLIQKYQTKAGVTQSGRSAFKKLSHKFRCMKSGKVPEVIVKPDIISKKKKKRGYIKKCALNLMKFGRELDEQEKTLEMECDEIDDDDSLEEDGSENEVELEKVKPKEKKKPKALAKDKKKMTVKSGKKEEVNSGKLVESKKTETGLQKKEKKKKKKKKRNLENGSVKPETPLKSDNLVKCKSPKDAFKIEDASGEDLKINTPRKRKALTQWQVHELEVDSEDYNKIKLPKIIKLETKVGSPLNFGSGVKVAKPDVEVDEPVKSVPLTPAFWQKAKEKVAKKKSLSNSLVKNPFFSNEEDQPKNSKRISFALERNEAQGNDEYLQEVKNSPKIPFDGTRKPVQSALKSGLSPSPINPFYRFRKK